MTAICKKVVSRTVTELIFLISFCKAEEWLSDRLKAVKKESFAEVADLSEKMRKLQKHQAFEAELKANAKRIEDIIKVMRLKCC